MLKKMCRYYNTKWKGDAKLQKTESEFKMNLRDGGGAKSCCINLCQHKPDLVLEIINSN